MSDLPAGWSPRSYRDDDAEELVRLLQQVFDGWPGVEISVEPVDHLRWKLSSHDTAKQYSIVAELDGRLVGSQLLIARWVQVGGQLLLSRIGTDMVVHPDYRKRGILAKMWALREEARHRFDLNLGQGGHAASRRLGRDTGRTEFGNATDILVHRASDAPPPAGAAWTIAGARTFDERIDGFFEEASRPYRFITVRNLEYLTWRYDLRAGDYSIRLAEDAGRILGYTVLATSHGAGAIADLLVLPERLDVAASLVADAIGQFGRSGISEVSCAVPTHHPYRDVLEQLGFDAKRRTIPLNYRHAAGDDALAFIGDPLASIHVTLGDTDLV